MGARELPSKQAIVIAGPTAGGKSALGVAMAERLGGMVINADSMQVYRDLRVLTARPSDEDMARAPHRLYGHVDAAEAYSVGRWLDDIRSVLQEAWANGQVPVIVGGTGLYLKALLQGLSEIPAVPDDVRQRVRRKAEARAPHELHAELSACDPLTAAKVKATDPQRIVRALEVWEATGLSLALLQQRKAAPLLPASDADGIFIALHRNELNARIERRFRQMMSRGALDEVAALAERELDPALPAMRALGVPSLIAHIRGEIGLDQAIAQSVLSTTQYAKRQMTFARHQLPSLRWIDVDDVQGELHGAGLRGTDLIPPDRG